MVQKCHELQAMKFISVGFCTNSKVDLVEIKKVREVKENVVALESHFY